MNTVPQQLPTPRSFFKKVLRALAWLLLAVLLLAGALLGLLFIYQDEVKAAVITELNRHLRSEVKIDPKNIDLTMIKTFPDCSVEFKNVLMLDALPLKKRDTLLFAGRINLHFNLSDLWQKQYRIHKLKIKDAVAKLRVLKDGQVNYLFWKSDSTAVKTEQNLAFELKQVSLEHCRLQYRNAQALWKTQVQVETLELGGNFSQANFELRAGGQLLVQELQQNQHVFLKNKNCRFKADVTVQEQRYSIKTCNLDLNQLALELNGAFTYQDGFRHVNLNFKAPRLDIASALSLLPAGFKSSFSDYESSGNFYAQGSFQYVSDKEFSLNTAFGIKNGTVLYKPNNIAAKQVQLEGQLDYSNSASSLRLKQIALQLNGDALNGSCAVTDFSDPYLDLSLQAALHLENLQAFFPIDTLEYLKGNIRLKTNIQGRWQELNRQAFSSKVRLELDAQLSGLETRFKGDAQPVAIENCAITAMNREIEVKDLKLKRGSSDLTLNGRLPGIFNYLVDRSSPLVIEGKLYSTRLKLEDFMLKYQASGGAGPLIPANVSFKLNAAILNFSYARFEATSLTGEIEIKNQKAMISDMKLEALEGEAQVDAYADNARNRLDVTLQSKLKNINISRLFYQLNNFGQSTLQDKNLKGYASADIEFSGSWNNKLEADYNSIHASCNLGVERGELIDFKPLLSLSRFVDIQDLQRIRFSSLRSNIRIANGEIQFPKTVIENSALNLTFWGTHRFNNTVDYHIQLLISELMAKKRKAGDDEFGPVENDPEDRRSAFIGMTGPIDNPKFKYLDLKGLKEKIKEDRQRENKNVKRILKEEFGLFKKDSTLKKAGKPAPVFELEKPNNNPPKKTLELKKKNEDEDF